MSGAAGGTATAAGGQHAPPVSAGSSAAAAVLRLASFSSAGILDELARELPDAYGVSGGLVMPIFLKCALSTSWGQALAAVHGEARAKERVEAVVRQNQEVFVVREGHEGQMHPVVALTPVMAQAFAAAATASAPPTPTAAAARTVQTPQTTQTAAAPAAASASAVSASASSAASPAPSPTQAPSSASGPSRALPAHAGAIPLAVPLDFQNLLVSLLRSSQPQSLTTLGCSFFTRTKRSFNEACAAAGIAGSLSTFLRDRPTVFSVVPDARPEHPPVISLAVNRENGAGATPTAATRSAVSTPAKAHQTASAMSSPAPAPVIMDVQGALVSALRASGQPIPIPTLATHFRERTGVAFRDTGTQQTLSDFLAQRPTVFRLEEDGRPQHPRLVSLVNGSPPTPAKAHASSSRSALSPPAPAAAPSPAQGIPAAAGPSDPNAQLELLVSILRNAPATPGRLPLATLAVVFNSRTGFRFGDAQRGTAQTLLDFLSLRPSIFRLWTEGANRTHLVALKMAKETAHTPAATGAVAASPSTPSQPAASWRLTGSASASAASPSAAAIDLQRVLVSLLTATPDPMPLNVLADSFRARTGFSFSEALAAIDKKQSMTAWLRDHKDVFQIEADERDQYPPLVSLVHAYRSRLRPAATPSTPAAVARSAAAGSVPATPVSDLTAAFADAAISTPKPPGGMGVAHPSTPAAAASAHATPTPKRRCHYYPKGFCHKGDQCTHLHDPQWDAINRQRAAEKAAAAEMAPAAAEGQENGPEAVSDCPSATSGSAAATAIVTPGPAPRPRLEPAESAAVDLVYSLLPNDGGPMLPSTLGVNLIKAARGFESWSEYSRTFNGGASLQRWLERHSDRIVVDKSRGTTPGKVFIYRAQVEGASGAAAAPSPQSHSHSSLAVASPAPHCRLGVHSPPPPPSTIIGWVCAILLESSGPTTQTNLGQAMRRQHGVVFVSAGSAPERAIKAAAAGGDAQSGSRLTMKAFLRAHPSFFSLQQAGDEIEVRLVNRNAAKAAAAAAVAAPSASSSAYATPRKSDHAAASPSEYVTATSPVPSTATILRWLLRLMLAAPTPLTQSDLGQLVRQRHGLVFFKTGAATAQHALDSADGAAAAAAQESKPTLSSFLHMPAHRHIFAFVPAGRETHVQLIDRQAAAIIAASPPSSSDSSSISASSHSSSISAGSAASGPASTPVTPVFRPTVKRGSAPTQGLPQDGWSGASLSASRLLGLLIGQPAQSVVPVGSGFYPVPGRPFITGTLLSMLHRTPLASLWTAAFPVWESFYDFLHSHPSHFAPADNVAGRGMSARWVVKEDAVAAVPPVAPPTFAEAGLLRLLDKVFRDAARSHWQQQQQQQSADGDIAIAQFQSPALSLDAIGRGAFLERGVPFESSSGGVPLADFLLRFRNFFCFSADGPLLVVRFLPMEAEAQTQTEAQAQPVVAAEARGAPAPNASVSASASAPPQPAASASVSPPLRKMPIAVMVLEQARPVAVGASSSVSAQVAPSVSADAPSPLPTPASSSVQRTVRMQVHVMGRHLRAPLAVSADCVAELRDELAHKLDEDDGALDYAHFCLHPPVDGQPLPPALTDEQLWALAKNSAVYAVLL